MKKIVFFNSSIQMGGPARIINLWCNYFSNKQYELEIVSNIDAPVFYDFDKSVKYSVLGIDKFKQKSKLKTLYKIYFFLKNRRNEVLIFNKGFYIGYLYILKQLRLLDNSLNIVYVVHGGTSDFKIIYNNLTIFMMHKTFKHLIVNYDDYDDFNKNVPKSIKRKFVDTLIKNNFSNVRPKITYLLNPATFKSSKTPTYDEKVVLAIGRLDFVKGFDLLIEAWGIIANQYPDWSLRIVGSGEEENNLRNSIKKLKLESNIEMIPTSFDIKTLFLNSSVYAMSSREEGLPMVVIEAMECGLPVVAFKSIGATLLVNENENGYLSEIGDINDLAKNLERLILDKQLRQTLGLNSKKMAEQYHIENIASPWNDILSD